MINVPGLVKTVMAVVENDMSLVGVGSTVNVEALSSKVLDVSVLSSNPFGFLVVLILPLSTDSSDTNSELISSLVGKGIGSL